MNSFGLLLLGCMIRGTALAAIGLLVGAVVARRSAAAGSLVSLKTLLVLFLVPIAVVSPWPHWWTLSPEPVRNAIPRVEPRVEPRGPAANPVAPVGAPVVPPGLPAPNVSANWTTILEAFFAELHRPVDAPQAQRWRWPAWGAVAVLASLALGLARLALGLRAVAVLRRHARPVDDPGLLDALDVHRAEMSCAQPVRLFESDQIDTPATIGWRRPAILVPRNWREWDEQERRVVLTHELAHIARGDYRSGLLAQLAVAVHFYHPLVHWLAARLRLQQELAADAWSAGYSGGNQPYITTLAQMALRQAERPIAWPARSFLPARGTFLRRLEMLRDAKQIRHVPTTGAMRVAVVGALAAATLLLAGVRLPGLVPAALAQTDRPKADDPGDALEYVPGDSVALVTARPAEVLALPEFKPIRELVNEAIRQSPARRLSANDFGRVTLFWLRNALPNDRRPSNDAPSGIVLKGTRAQDWKQLQAELANDAEEVAYRDRTYIRSKALAPFCAFIADDRTLLLADEVLLRDLIKAGRHARPRLVWGRLWEQVDRGQLTAAVDCDWIRERLRATVLSGPQPVAAIIPFTPLWEKTRALTLGINGVGGLKVDALASCEDSDDAKEVADTLRAALTLGRNSLHSLHQQARRSAGRDAQAMTSLVLLSEVFEPLLEKAEVKVDEAKEGSTVRLRSVTDTNLASVINAFVPAVGAARGAARRVQSANNLKQIGLAFHNYAAAYGHFPPAAGFAPNSKHPHSWRVALLPFLDQAQLYNEYHFDEPWDSPNNRALIARIPGVYRAPADNGKPTSSSYFVIAGPGTIFSDDNATAFAQITDGLSNTILAVEAKRDIPWTKPEDIPFDPRGPLPKVGGFSADGTFEILLADGAVKAVSQSIEPLVFRALLTRAGGEVIELDRVEAPAGSRPLRGGPPALPGTGR
jgi:hypothetical protein